MDFHPQSNQRNIDSKKEGRTAGTANDLDYDVICCNIATKRKENQTRPVVDNEGPLDKQASSYNEDFDIFR